jgi:hypothetical protein
MALLMKMGKYLADDVVENLGRKRAPFSVGPKSYLSSIGETR